MDVPTLLQIPRSLPMDRQLAAIIMIACLILFVGVQIAIALGL